MIILRPRMHEAALGTLVELDLDDAALEMVGGTNTGTHYSLPGRVRVTFPALSAAFGGRYRLLHNLTVTFEGKSEYVDPERYMPLRVHRTSLSLLTNSYTISPICPTYGTITIDLPFDLRVPGWLPPSHVSRHATTSYGLVAEATVGWANETHYSRVPCATPLIVDGAFAPARTTRSAYTPIRIKRHRLHQPMPADESPRRHWPFKCKTLPVDLTIKHAEYVDLADPKGIKIDMHLRANSSARCEGHEASGGRHECASFGAGGAEGRGLSASASTSVSASGPASESAPHTSPDDDVAMPCDPEPVAHVVHIAMEIEEREDVRSTPSAAFLASYPLPNQDGALLGPSRAPAAPPPTSEPTRRRIQRACLLLPTGQPQSHTFDKARPVGPTTKRIKGALTFNQVGRFPQPDMSGPFTHVTFQRGGLFSTETFKTPVRLVTCPSPDVSGAVPPPYVTVFYENGDQRDCDPLPLYVPAEDDVEMVESLTRNVTSAPEQEPETMLETTPEATPEPPSSSQRLGEEHRRAADNLSPANRKLFEQWAREASTPIEDG
ncbi:unnamed protein product [Cutaneotrichosporon oleaginosum]